MNRSLHVARYLLTGLLIFLTLAGQAQEPYQLARVIPPSPTAAALGSYGDFNVGYYAGMPEISIPLYEIKTNDHDLKIALNYTASGTRVADMASWVGLGWSLSAGGVISRTIRGQDDFLANFNTGYYNGPTLPPSNPDNTYQVNANSMTTDLDFFQRVQGGMQDGEPDLFSYNIAGYTGKFVLGKSIDGSPVYVDQRNNLKFQYSNSNWTMINAEGYSYYFGTKELVRNYYFSSPTLEISDEAPLSSFYIDNTRFISISAWYLDSIVSPAHETIQFIYTSGQSLSLISKSEVSNDLLAIAGGCDGSGSTTPTFPSNKQYSASRQQIQDVYLQKIIFKNGSVNFTTSDRLDIDYVDVNNKPAKLSGITVNDANNQLIKRWDLYTSYFSSYMGTPDRLKLDSVAETGASGEKKPPYVLSYYAPYDVPLKYTKALDHWGYYNGHTENTTLLPAMTLTGIVPPRFLPGGTRDPDTANLYPQNGVLSTISYPTGGHTSFEYELNDYSNLAPDEAYVMKGVGATVTAGDVDQANYHMVEFDIAEPTSVHVFILYDDQCNPTCATSGPMDNFGMIYSSNGTTFVFAINNGQTQQDFDRILPPGHYNLLVYYEQGFNTTISAHWQIKVPVLQKKGGGIRLKAIRSFDGIGVTKVKKFDYTAGGKSSGRLINNPLYSYYFDQGQSVHMDQGGSSFGCEYVGTYITRQSNAVLTTGLSGGGAVVGYDKVTVLEGENGEGGRTEHYFYNAAGSYDVNAFPSTPIYISPFNGKESTEIVYDAAGNKVSRKDYTYTFNEYATLKGLKIFAGMLTTDGSFLVKFFDNPSYWVVPVAETDVLYANGDSSVTSKNYYFNNPGNRELSRMEASMSDGRTSITKYKRPDDYPSAGTSSFAAQMVAQHILSPVVEQQTLITDASSTKLVSGSFTSYAPYNGAVYKPNVVYRLELTGPSADTTASAISGAGAVSYHSAYQPALYFDQYDGASNLVATHKMDEINQAYIWDYHSAYPIAQIEHAALQDVAYTSFEADGSGGWIIGSGSRDAGGVTGVECYNLAGGACNKSGLTAATTYIVSYWSKTLNSYNVSGSTGFKQGKTVVLDGVSWAYFEHVVTGVSAVSVSGSGDIDELRLYPADARMNTYTYIPLVGMSSSCDVSNRVTYYEYDGLPRLVRIRDMDKNILKQYDYQYQYPAKFYNIAESGAFTTSCTGGGVPSQIVYTVQASTYTSAISQADADAKAQSDVNANGQNYANTHGSCTFYNVVKNGTYTTSCAPGGTPSQVTYTVAAGAYSSTIGQADADAKAQNDVNANGQNYANTHGTCTFYSAAQAGNFTRNNCAAGGSPSTVPYSIAAGAYTSLISQADANQQAVNALNTLGQNNANANGTCTFYNAYLIQSFTRNNCSPGQIGGTMTYSVPAGKYSSTISQADADAKAHNDMNTNGQTVVNNNASCTQPTIYAKMFYENGHPSPDGYVADIVVRFFSDANYTQPMYVYDLTVNWAIDGHCEWEHFNTFSDQATGYSLYLRTQYPINYPDPDSQEGSGYMCNDVYLLQAGNYVYL